MTPTDSGLLPDKTKGENFQIKNVSFFFFGTEIESIIYFFMYVSFFILFFNFTILYLFCHISK